MTRVFAPTARAISKAAVATPPPIPQIKHPLAFPELRFRDEHPVGRLVHERERSGGLEVDRVVEGNDVAFGHRDQLAVRSVGVLPDHGDHGSMLEPGIDHDPLPGVDPDAGPVGAQDARLRDRRETLPHPEVEVVE